MTLNLIDGEIAQPVAFFSVYDVCYLGESRERSLLSPPNSLSKILMEIEERKNQLNPVGGDVRVF